MRPPGIPSLRRHKASSQGLVTLNGKDHYLGLWPAHIRRAPAAVQQAYESLVAEWLASGRGLGAPLFTVNALILRFLQHAVVHYRRADGSLTHEVIHFKQAFRDLRRLFGNLPAAEFSPLKLKTLRDEWVTAGYARSYVNQRVGRVKRLFKFGVAEELVPALVFQALQALNGLQRGRSEARENEAVQPVAAEAAHNTLPFLGRRVAAMVQLQMLTGMRSGEVVRMRPCDIDREGLVWVYRPNVHKMSYRDKDRIVPLGSRAQAVLEPFIDGRPLEVYLFDPREEQTERNAKRMATRKTPVRPNNRTQRVASPKRSPRAHYTPDTYGRAIARACEAAGIEHWHPHQLRHLFATDVRRQFGLEPTQVLLGHAHACITEVYADKNLKAAIDVAAQIG
jgi:integrase